MRNCCGERRTGRSSGSGRSVPKARLGQRRKMKSPTANRASRESLGRRSKDIWRSAQIQESAINSSAGQNHQTRNRQQDIPLGMRGIPGRRVPGSSKSRLFGAILRASLGTIVWISARNPQLLVPHGRRARIKRIFNWCKMQVRHFKR